MGYDEWSNIGYKVIDKINSFDEILTDIRKDLIELKSNQAKLQMKMWAIGIGATILASIGSAILKF